MKIIALEFVTNMFGNIDEKIKKRLEAVINKPTQKTWDDSYSIILSGSGKMTTLWQAVLMVDPSFTRRKGENDKWPEIPSSEKIIEAIQFVTIKNKISAN